MLSLVSLRAFLGFSWASLAPLLGLSWGSLVHTGPTRGDLRVPLSSV